MDASITIVSEGSLDSQIITFHKEFQERKAEKARKEAEEREERFNI